MGRCGDRNCDGNEKRMRGMLVRRARMESAPVLLRFLFALLCTAYAAGADAPAFSKGLRIVSPYHHILDYSPAHFGTILLSPGYQEYDLKYVGRACESFVGTVSVRGKAVLVDRGKCTFVQKARHVAQAGGVAMLVASDSEELFIMTGDGDSNIPRLPAFLLRQTDGDRLREDVQQGSQVVLGLGLDLGITSYAA